MKTMQPAKRHSTPNERTFEPESLFVVNRARAKKAALLSIVPGVGQIYCGQKLKGILFLSISGLNLLLLISMMFSKQLLASSILLTEKFHIGINEKFIHSLLGAGLNWSSPATILYFLLLTSFILYSVRDAYSTAARPWQRVISPKQSFLLSEAISGSYLFHISVVITLCTLVLFFIAPPLPTEQATDIELISEIPEKRSPAPPKATPKPEEPIVKPQPVHQKVVNQPTPVAIATPTDTPSPDPVSTEPAASSGTAQGTGQAGNGNGSGAEIDFGPYLAEMKRRIKKAWYPPKGNESKTITVSFKISHNGAISDINLLKSSGLSIADDAAVSAIETVSPLPQPPAGAPDPVEVRFSFDYNIFNGGKSSISSN